MFLYCILCIIYCILYILYIIYKYCNLALIRLYIFNYDNLPEMFPAPENIKILLHLTKERRNVCRVRKFHFH